MIIQKIKFCKINKDVLKSINQLIKNRTIIIDSMSISITSLRRGAKLVRRRMT